MVQEIPVGPAATTSSEFLLASPELRQLIESLIDSAAVPPSATLSDVRRVVLEGGIFIGDGELLFAQDRTFLLNEIDELIERCGAQGPVRDCGKPRPA